MKSVAGRPHYCFFKLSFSPGVRAVHRSQFQATSALWSKASNLHYSLIDFRPRPRPRRPPSPNTHNSLTTGSVTAVGVPGRARSAFSDEPSPAPPTAGDWPAGSAEPGSVGSYKSYAGLRHSCGGCRAGPDWPFVTDPASTPHCERLTHETSTAAALPRQTHTTLLRRALSQPWGVRGRARSTFCDGPGPAPPTAGPVGGNPGSQNWDPTS
jgi:hypothetical protein